MVAILWPLLLARKDCNLKVPAAKPPTSKTQPKLSKKQQLKVEEHKQDISQIFKQKGVNVGTTCTFYGPGGVIGGKWQFYEGEP